MASVVANVEEEIAELEKGQEQELNESKGKHNRRSPSGMTTRKARATAELKGARWLLKEDEQGEEEEP
jgi:hypothetical protein